MGMDVPILSSNGFGALSLSREAKRQLVAKVACPSEAFRRDILPRLSTHSVAKVVKTFGAFHSRSCQDFYPTLHRKPPRFSPHPTLKESLP